MRQEGGIWIQPFLDYNHNGLQDETEPLYVEDANQLLTLNHQDLVRYHPRIDRSGIFIDDLRPGDYRVDLDPAGYPIDWTAEDIAYGIEVVAGSYTTVLIPFDRSYTVAGIVQDENSKPLMGITIEAVALMGTERSVSVTNGAGIFFLENLRQGDYEIYVDGRLTSHTVNLTSESETFIELDIQSPVEESVRSE
ncbi:MAG: hypothetical protein DCF15_22630 [Phormidesmis priestleyi]|uniref:SD-repeat containing protein B domain-containing protein n=1 Tax=Phormidesmis priestleyi TaxID=268141 RepID=A0A2W4Y6Q9_9CYAN|nr:MAG: hypothetical protein DCF15_22630 [Phormidesmis priestleyi]